MEVLETTMNTGSAVADPKVLNKDTTTTLINMLKSSDKSDHTMAQLILNQLDVEKSIYWIWKISKESWITNNMVNLRTKASRKFRDESDLFVISNQTVANFTAWLVKKEWMTPEIYSYIVEDLVYELRYRMRGMDSTKMFEFEFKLKEEYQKYNPENPKIKL
jgi:hypothetical protein